MFNFIKVDTNFIFVIFLLLLFSLFSPVLYAVSSASITEVQFLELFIKSMGGLKGAGTLGVVGIFIKLLLSFAHTKMSDRLFKDLSGAMKMSIVLGLSLISGIIGLMVVSDLTFGAALIHSSTLSAFVVLSDQMFKHYIKKGRK